jgi:hypothetical protein
MHIILKGNELFINQLISSQFMRTMRAITNLFVVVPNPHQNTLLILEGCLPLLPIKIGTT